MTSPMTRRLLMPLAALCVGGAVACVDLTETPITGITSAYYDTPVGFEAAVNSMYTPMRRRTGRSSAAATMTVFGTDEFQKGADGNYKCFNDYTSALNADVDYIRVLLARLLLGDQHGQHGPRRRADREHSGSDQEPSRRRGASSCARCTLQPRPHLRRHPAARSSRRAGVTTETTREPVAKVYKQMINDLLAAESGTARQGGAVRPRRQAGRPAPAGRGLPDARRGAVTWLSRPRRPRPWRTTRGSSCSTRTRRTSADRQRGQLRGGLGDPVHRRSAHERCGQRRQQAAPVLGIPVRSRGRHAARHRQRPSLPPLPSHDVAARLCGIARRIRATRTMHKDVWYREQPQRTGSRRTRPASRGSSSATPRSGSPASARSRRRSARRRAYKTIRRERVQ